MGRYAQNRKRGGHLGEQPGLPAGPEIGVFEIDDEGDVLNCTFLPVDNPGYNWFVARWRVPALGGTWAASPDNPQQTLHGNTAASPFEPVSHQQQDCEIAYCDHLGAVLTQWSGYRTNTPA